MDASRIFHLAGVYKPKRILEINIDDWKRCMIAKVDGACALHFACLRLDTRPQFILFGSLFGIVPLPKLSSYQGANVFLSAFS